MTPQEMLEDIIAQTTVSNKRLASILFDNNAKTGADITSFEAHQDFISESEINNKLKYYANRLEAITKDYELYKTEIEWRRGERV